MKRPKKTGDQVVDAAIAATVRDLPRVVSCGSIAVTTAPLSVAHTLGETPDFWIANPQSDVRVFASEASRLTWSPTNITIEASAAGTVTLFVGKL